MCGFINFKAIQSAGRIGIYMDFIFDVRFSDDRRGNADAKVTINIPSGILAVLYWADENGKPLEDYLPIKALALIDGKAEYSLEHNRMIPENAKKILCKVYNDFMYEIVLPELCADIPEEKLIAERKPDLRVFVTSDLHFGGKYFHNDRNRALAFKYMSEANPDFILISGDITDNSYPEEFSEAFDTINAVFGKIPVFVGAGNHDYSPYKPGATPHFDEMHDFFVKQCERNAALGVTVNDLNDRNYFEARFGNVQVLMLNANDVGNHFEVGENERLWMDNKLAETDGKDVYRFVVTHFHQQNTVGCSERKAGKNFFRDNDQTQELLDRHGKIIHVSGHTHYNFDSDMPNTYFDNAHSNLYLNAGCAVWNGVDMEERREYYLQDRCTGQLIEFYSDGTVISRGVDFVSGKYIPRCLHKANVF